MYSAGLSSVHFVRRFRATVSSKGAEEDSVVVPCSKECTRRLTTLTVIRPPSQGEGDACLFEARGYPVLPTSVMKVETGALGLAERHHSSTAAAKTQLSSRPSPAEQENKH